MPREHTALLLNDLTKVHDNATDHRVFTQGIIRCDASPEEVIEWYRQQDPLEEDLTMSVFMGMENGMPHQIIRAVTAGQERMQALEIGAACLVANVYLKDEVAAAGEKDWASAVINAIADNPDKYDTDLSQPFAPDELIAVSLTEGKGRRLDLEEARLIFMASEMIMASAMSRYDSMGALILGTSMGEEERQKRLTPIAERRAANQNIHNFLIGLCRRETALLVDEQPAARLLQLQIMEQSLAMHPVMITTREQPLVIIKSDEADPDPEPKAMRHQLIDEYLDFLKQEFDGPERLQGQTIEGANLKGFMHEAIWLLDTLMIREMDDDHYTVTPSLSYQDQPWFGYPKLNRGYDFTIKGNGKIELNFQLKSSGRREVKPYHPNIDVLVEKNFMDINPKRLGAKIAAYKRAIKSGFDPEECEKARKYLLPTAVQAVEMHRALETSNPANHAQLRADRYGIQLNEATLPRPMNRAERRAAAKQQKRKGKQTAR